MDQPRGSDESLARIEQHYHTFFGPHRRSRVDLVEKYPCDLLIFDPTPERLFYTIATRGMSAKVMTPHPGWEPWARQELLVYIPAMFPVDLEAKDQWTTWVAMYLYFAARYSLDQDVFMGPGSVGHMEDHRPDKFKDFPFALYIPPLCEKSAFYPLEYGNTVVNFSAIMPITQAETNYLKTHQLRGLLDRVDRKGEYNLTFDPYRNCVISKRTQIEIENERHVETYERILSVQEHYKKHFGEPTKNYELAVLAGENSRQILNIDIYPPTDARPYYTMATSGISAVEIKLPPEKKEYTRHELLLYISKDWSPDNTKSVFDLHWASRLLVVLAKYIFTKKAPVAPMFTIPLGSSVTPDSIFDTVLISWPLFESKEFNRMTFEGEREETIRFSQVILITKAEAESELSGKSGIEFLKKLDAMGLLDQVSDPARPCMTQLVSPRQSSFRVCSPNFESPYAPTMTASPQKRFKPAQRRTREQDDDAEPTFVFDTLSKVIGAMGAILFITVMLIMRTDWFDKVAPKDAMPKLLMGSVLLFIALPYSIVFWRSRR